MTSGSGFTITDALFKDLCQRAIIRAAASLEHARTVKTSGALLEMHPVHVDPMSSLAGGYMVNFLSYRQPAWNPDFDYSHLLKEQNLYKLHPGIGAVQHFCQDMTIGFSLGWGGILENIRHYRTINTDEEAQELYDGLEHMVLGIQNWIGRNAAAARKMAEEEVRSAIPEEPPGDGRDQ